MEAAVGVQSPLNAVTGDALSPVGRVIGMNDFKRGLKDVRPSVRPWFETARNYALYANEGGVYDELIEYLRARRIL